MEAALLTKSADSPCVCRLCPMQPGGSQTLLLVLVKLLVWWEVLVLCSLAKEVIMICILSVAHFTVIVPGNWKSLIVVEFSGGFKVKRKFNYIWHLICFASRYCTGLCSACTISNGCLSLCSNNSWFKEGSGKNVLTILGKSWNFLFSKNVRTLSVLLL